MKFTYRGWTIDSFPRRQIFHFFDIGYYDTEAAAYQRGVEWAKAWLDDNF
jgi:hypothetical protein